MFTTLARLIPIFFYLLFFFIPLVLFPKTSELFEFNKMILTYALTVLIISSWFIKMIIRKRIIIRRTTLDIPLLVFLSVQVLATLTSIDTRTSIFGYYSRFHGGLLSSISYSVLYWAFVSNMDKKKTIKSIYIFLASAVLVSLYGVAQHLGIDKDVWVQDVQSRVFSTLGQPNWLAAWLVALIPITWALALNSKSKVKRSLLLRSKSSKLQLKIHSYWTWLILSSLFFLTLLYTGSRSGMLGFGVAYIIFWGGIVLKTLKDKKTIKTRFKKFLILNFAFIIIALSAGTQWTPSIVDLLNKSSPPIVDLPRGDEVVSRGTALEVGGTESGKIRQIVWTGARDIWRNYPILGTGVETFAFSYYNFRPAEHNLVSEWNYLYNKAHNEYLNIAATTGSLGLATYFLLTGFILLSFVKNIPKSKFQNPNNYQNSKLKNSTNLSFDIWNLSLMSGFASILVTNFFGFSVVPVALQFFLYPAIAIAIRGKQSLTLRDKQSLTLRDERQEIRKENEDITNSQKMAIAFLLLITFYLLLITGRYWYADFLYSKGKLENDSKNYVEGQNLLIKAVELSGGEAIFWEELSESTTHLALLLFELEDEKTQEFADQAFAETQKALSLSPANVNIKRSVSNFYIKLSKIDPTYLIQAKNTLEAAVKLAPTDAQLRYNLGLAHIRLGDLEKARDVLVRTAELKPNYKNARFALALVFVDLNDNENAIKELEYILENIGQDDLKVLKELEALKKI